MSSSSDTGFLIPAAQHRTEMVIDRSRFITTVSHAATPQDARAFMDTIRAEFQDATHNCWAYVAGAPGDTAAIGMSDAGEPHGTAGRPMLDVLLHSGIGEIVAVVTRYYGGSKLGTGGLVKAYSGSVQQALASLPTAFQVERVTLQITASYADVDTLKRALQEFEGLVVSADYGEAVIYEVAVPVHVAEACGIAMVDRTAGRAVVTRAE